MLLGCVLKNTFAAEHLFVVDAVKLNFFGGMSGAEFDASDVDGCCRLTLLVGLHWEACEYLVIDREIVWLNLMGRFVVWTLDDAVLWQFSATFKTETVTAWQR